MLDACPQLGPSENATARVHPEATGVFVYGQNSANGDEATLLLDAGGAVVAHMRKRLTHDVWHVGVTADGIITPLLDLTLGVLRDCGAAGKVLFHLDVRIAPTARGSEPILEVYTAQSRGQLRAPPDHPAFFGGHISLPIEPGADRVLADQMMREIARTSGIDWWE